MSNIISYILCFGWLFPFLMGLLGLLLGWLLFRGRKIEGDLSIEGEGALRAEADGLRARVKELEGRVSTKDTEVSGLKSKLAAAAAGAGAAAVATKVADSGDDDEAYALEWRNRYLAARVKYLEGRLSEEPKAKAAPKKRRVAKKTAAPKAKAAAKKAAPKKKTIAKKSSAPKVLYTDGPTDGPKDDLELISGIGPKFEKEKAYTISVRSRTGRKKMSIWSIILLIVFQAEFSAMNGLNRLKACPKHRLIRKRHRKRLPHGKPVRSLGQNREQNVVA